MIRGLVVVALASSCVSTHTTRCEDNKLCPDGTECVSITFTDQVESTCVHHDQRVSCEALEDGVRCMVGATEGTCHDQVCFPDECSNRLVDIGEACDDGNTFTGDGCSATCVSNETCSNGVTDLVMGETCDDGGALSNDGCSSRCATESPTWTRLENARPLARTRAGLVYDVARRRVVMFGGANGQLPVAQTREWDGHRWSSPIVFPEPLPRTGHLMAYDEARGQTVMFGGNRSREMWIRDRDGTWSLSTVDLRPPALTGASMVYDAGRRRVVLFGGLDAAATSASNATWFWDGTAWSELSMPRPPPRFFATMAYDPKRGVVVLTGGRDYFNVLLDDVWELDGDTWVEVRPATRPPPRISAAMTWDPATNRVVLVGGQLGVLPADPLSKETWAWNGMAWARLADAKVIGPDTGLSSPAMTTDPARGRMVLIGSRGDVQEWDGTQWTIVDQLVLPEPLPSARSGHAAALDPLRREVVVFGGATSGTNGTASNETWIWNGTWRQAAVTPLLLARRGATIVFDEARSEMVMFGGCGLNTSAETWVWKSGGWSKKLPARSPPGRCSHSTAYDPVRKKVVVYGGTNTATGEDFDDLWTWDGSTWTEQTPLPRPAGRLGAAMAYDPVNDRIVLFGGLGNGVLGDTWLWDGQAWTQVASFSSPSPRSFGSIAWDAARQRIVMFAGRTMMSATAEVWEFDGTSWATTPTPRPPIARSRHTLVSDPDGAGVLMFGGYQDVATTGPLNDVWRLAWGDTDVQELCTEADTDHDGRIGSADADCWSVLTPLCSPRPPTMTCDPLASRCGDSACNAELESCASCPSDCGACAVGCGNFACDTGETMASCPGDCGA